MGPSLPAPTAWDRHTLGRARHPRESHAARAIPSATDERRPTDRHSLDQTPARAGPPQLACEQSARVGVSGHHAAAVSRMKHIRRELVGQPLGGKRRWAVRDVNLVLASRARVSLLGRLRCQELCTRRAAPAAPRRIQAQGLRGQASSVLPISRNPVPVLQTYTEGYANNLLRQDARGCAPWGSSV